MKVICIDDEPIILDFLTIQLKKIKNIEIVGAYTKSDEGLEQVLTNDVDIVFLDIRMPEMTGMEIASEILNHKPNIFIVFVTAYEHYAVEAFEMEAVDYLLKPIRLD